MDIGLDNVGCFESVRPFLKSRLERANNVQTLRLLQFQQILMDHRMRVSEGLKFVVRVHGGLGWASNVSTLYVLQLARKWRELKRTMLFNAALFSESSASASDAKNSSSSPSSSSVTDTALMALQPGKYSTLQELLERSVQLALHGRHMSIRQRWKIDLVEGPSRMRMRMVSPQLWDTRKPMYPKVKTVDDYISHKSSARSTVPSDTASPSVRTSGEDHETHDTETELVVAPRSDSGQEDSVSTEDLQSERSSNQLAVVASLSNMLCRSLLRKNGHFIGGVFYHCKLRSVRQPCTTGDIS